VSAKKVLLVHGVHSGNGYDHDKTVMAEALGVEPKELILFKWAQLLDQSALDLRRLGLKLALGWARWGDFVDDIVSYLLDSATRKRCIRNLQETVRALEPDVVIAHSLGSVLACQALRGLPNTPRLVMVGSPLWFRPLRWLLKLDDGLPDRGPNQMVISGKLDPVSGFGKSFGAGHLEQPWVGHDLLGYLNHCKLFL